MPESARPVLSSASEAARKDAARVDTVYQFLPSAKNPSGTSSAANLQELLDRALAKIEGAPRDVSAAEVASSAKSAPRAPEPPPIEQTLKEKPIGNADQHSQTTAIVTETSQRPARIWPWVVTIAVLAAVLVAWQLIRKSR